MSTNSQEKTKSQDPIAVAGSTASDVHATSDGARRKNPRPRRSISTKNYKEPGIVIRRESMVTLSATQRSAEAFPEGQLPSKKAKKSRKATTPKPTINRRNVTTTLPKTTTTLSGTKREVEGLPEDFPPSKRVKKTLEQEYQNIQANPVNTRRRRPCTQQPPPYSILAKARKEIPPAFAEAALRARAESRNPQIDDTREEAKTLSRPSALHLQDQYSTPPLKMQTDDHGVMSPGLQVLASICVGAQPSPRSPARNTARSSPKEDTPSQTLVLSSIKKGITAPPSVEHIESNEAFRSNTTSPVAKLEIEDMISPPGESSKEPESKGLSSAKRVRFEIAEVLKTDPKQRNLFQPTGQPTASFSITNESLQAKHLASTSSPSVETSQGQKSQEVDSSNEYSSTMETNQVEGRSDKFQTKPETMQQQRNQEVDPSIESSSTLKVNQVECRPGKSSPKADSAEPKMNLEAKQSIKESHSSSDSPLKTKAILPQRNQETKASLGSSKDVHIELNRCISESHPTTDKLTAEFFSTSRRGALLLPTWPLPPTRPYRPFAGQAKSTQTYSKEALSSCATDNPTPSEQVRQKCNKIAVEDTCKDSSANASTADASKSKPVSDSNVPSKASIAQTTLNFENSESEDRSSEPTNTLDKGHAEHLPRESIFHPIHKDDTSGVQRDGTVSNQKLRLRISLKKERMGSITIDRTTDLPSASVATSDFDDAVSRITPVDETEQKSEGYSPLELDSSHNSDTFADEEMQKWAERFLSEESSSQEAPPSTPLADLAAPDASQGDPYVDPDDFEFSPYEVYATGSWTM